MKASKLLLFVLLFVAFSCKPEHFRDNDRIEGSWQLMRLTYTDSLGQGRSIDNSQTFITFYYDARNRRGIQDANSKQFKFSYSMGFGTCGMAVDSQGSLPIDAIGRVQVYRYRFLGRKKVEFSTDWEYDYNRKETLKNVNYTFVKK